ncbi:MAG: sigma-70 family RNA polymerase sigma factor [Acidobacteria bacterium]|nr:sigma-70 family RNA polymerase sigma factor [Acidobacteriota bacterium]
MSLSLPALAAQTEVVPTAITAADFDRIVRQYQRKVYRVLLLILKRPEDADNLTQECFLRAYMSMRSFRGDCSVQTWLLRIAVNLARDEARNRRAGFWKRLLGLEDAGVGMDEYEPPCVKATPERGLIAQQELAAVWQAVDKLSPRQKEVFILRFAEEMQLKEIAEVLNLRTGTVKAQLFRAVTSVREQVRR